MAVPFATRNQLILIKKEGTKGTDAVPTPASNAVKFERPAPSYNLESTETDEATGGIDAAPSLIGGYSLGFGGAFYLQGSGAAGTAPRYGGGLEACSLGETVTAAAVTGTATAGASGTITLESADLTSDGQHTGARITLTGGTGSGQTRLIVKSNGTTKIATVDRAWTVTPDATSAYSIEANVRYGPAAALPGATIYRYHHHDNGTASTLEKMLGGVGSRAAIRLTAREGARRSAVEVEFRGALVEPADVSRPADPTYDAVQPPPWINAPTYLSGAVIQPVEVSLDLGLEATLESNVNQPSGFDGARIVNRRLSGTMVLPKDLIANRDFFTAWRDRTEYAFSTYWGSVAGNRVALVIPNLVIRSFGEADEGRAAYWSVQFETAAIGLRAALCLA